MKQLLSLLSIFSFALLTACGGGSSSSTDASTDDFQQGSTSVAGLDSPETVSIVDATE
ncbi:MAG: hypothetical protein HUJ13_04460 [Hydrogenovibrio crunogenus]|nr:hypothetical protein [Hydrogenovibrio crunogenus]